MSKYWSELAKNTEPYTPGEQPQDKEYIKLNTNENPYPPSPEVIEAIKKAANEKLRLYPDPDCTELKQVAANYYGVKEEEVFVGNGSDEVLAFLFMAFFDGDKPILLPNVTYSFYPVYANLFNINYELAPLEDDFSLSVDKFFKPNGGVIFPNPNAPTGKYVPLEKIEKLLMKNKEEVVVIDEAYIDFGGQSAVRLIKEHPNLVITRTLSKSHSLAGLRVGFVLGQEHLIEGLKRIKNSFNSYTLDRLALAGAVAALKDEAYFQLTKEKIIVTRDWVTEELRALGFEVISSKANFIFIKPPNLAAADLFQQLKEAGILVRYFDQPRIDDYLRVSIGTKEEMKYLLERIKEIIN